MSNQVLQKWIDVDQVTRALSNLSHTSELNWRANEAWKKGKKGIRKTMDYALAALKLFCGQLKDARPSSSPSSLSLGSVLFQRAWLQGVLVSDSGQGCFMLDDGSGTIELLLSNEFQQQEWKSGMYVMVVGAYIVQTDGPPFIKVHKIVDLSPFPDREAMWYLEVIEAYKLFYGPSLDD